MNGAGDFRTDALRPLHAVEEQRARLRQGGLDAPAEREALLQLAGAVERSLRRLLRDSEAAPLQLRLRALDPSELSADELLADLRQHGRISLELAASVHQLLQTRDRLRRAGPVEVQDAPNALRTVERLESEVASPAPDPATAPAPAVEVMDHTVVQPVPPPERGARRWLGLAGGAVLLLVLLFAASRLLGGGDDSELARGITLFRSGAYQDAAAHFWRYAEANPDDATPQLYLARIHRRLGRVDLAAPALRRALELAPEDADVHAEMGFLLLQTGRAETAVERFRTALTYDAESAEAWIGLVSALEASGRPDAAQRVLARAPERVRDAFSRRAAAPGDSAAALP